MTANSLPQEAQLGMRFWLLTLAAVIGVGVTFSLGQWQLARAAQKQALHRAIEDKKSLPAVNWRDLLASENIASLVYRPTVLRGRWLPDHTVFLDNRQLHGIPGFFVLTLLQPEQGGAAVLVQRGWVQRNFLDRSQLPAVQTPAGVQQIDGHIAPPPSRMFEPGNSADRAQGFSRIRQNIDLAAFGAEIRQAVLPMSVLQSGAPSEGLQRDWPEIGTGVEKHYGYAFQWFALAGLIATLYVWFQIVRRFFPSRR